MIWIFVYFCLDKFQLIMLKKTIFSEMLFFLNYFFHCLFHSGINKFEIMIKYNYYVQLSGTNHTYLSNWHPEEACFKWVCFSRTIFIHDVMNAVPKNVFF